jgi:hypothetical protein
MAVQIYTVAFWVMALHQFIGGYSISPSTADSYTLKMETPDPSAQHLKIQVPLKYW